MSCVSLWHCEPLDPGLEGLQGFCDDGLLWQLVPQPDGGREERLPVDGSATEWDSVSVLVASGC